MQLIAHAAHKAFERPPPRRSSAAEAHLQSIAGMLLPNAPVCGPRETLRFLGLWMQCLRILMGPTRFKSPLSLRRPSSSIAILASHGRQHAERI